MKTCPSCQQSYPDDVESCPRDRTPLVAEIRDERECPHCAERILRKAHVCKHCRREVEPLAGGDAPVQIPSPAPPQGIPEMRSLQPHVGKPAAAASRPLTVARQPHFQISAESPSRVKYVVCGFFLRYEF